MPRAPKPLTSAQIKAITTPGRHRVAENLYLRITNVGGRFWDARFTVGLKRRWKALGEANKVPLQVAKRLALEIHEEETDAVTMRKFGTVWHEYIEHHAGSWRSAIHYRQWVQTGNDYVLPVLGEIPVGDIKPFHVVEILRPLWKDKHESARRIRGRVALVIDYENARVGADRTNPADLRYIKNLLPRHRQVEKHHAAPTVDELKALLATLGDDPSHQCLRWLAMTACRTSEARFARCEDVVDGVWVIPADKMKGGREHRVMAPWQPTGKGLIFHRKGQALSLNAMRSLLIKRDIKWTVHGIRACFSTWATAEGYDSRLIENQLAHADDNQVRAAYARGDLLDQREAMMRQWCCAISKFVCYDSNSTQRYIPTERKNATRDLGENQSKR